MAGEDVAAGDGAFSTWTDLGPASHVSEGFNQVGWGPMIEVVTHASYGKASMPKRWASG